MNTDWLILKNGNKCKKTDERLNNFDNIMRNVFILKYARIVELKLRQSIF